MPKNSTNTIISMISLSRLILYSFCKPSRNGRPYTTPKGAFRINSQPGVAARVAIAKRVQSLKKQDTIVMIYRIAGEDGVALRQRLAFVVTAQPKGL
jgi:hypothetical protein